MPGTLSVLAFCFLITIVILAVIFLVVPLLKGIVWMIGGLFNSLGWIIRHVFEFVGGMLKDSVRFVGAIIAFVVLLPMAGAIVARMDEHGGYGHVAALRRWLARMPGEGYDFHDPRALGADDSEFLDHIHPGDVVYLRMLRAILEARPDSALAPYLDADALDRAIHRARGLRHLPPGDGREHA